MPSTHLFIIDPQNDFCDLPSDWCPMEPSTGVALRPTLPVTGAHADMLRLASYIDQAASAITHITITLDSHHRLDIAHPGFWVQADGRQVVPFTSITAAQVRSGQYTTRQPERLPRALHYLDALAQRGRYTLMVWPVHCEIGSWGHNVHASVKAAYNRWEDQTNRTAQKISKGSNPWTEHYSAMQAEVPDEDDASTLLNRSLIQTLDQSERIIIAGQASSHCVKATTEHLVANLPLGQPNKVTLLTDCMSPVAGFEAQHQAFFDDMARQGVVLSTSPERLSTL